MEIKASAKVAAECFANEVLAEMARHRFSRKELIRMLGITPYEAKQRLNGRVPFNVIEMSLIAMWLRVDLATLVDRARTAAFRSPEHVCEALLE